MCLPPTEGTQTGGGDLPAPAPWPDLGSWRAIRDPHQRLARALDELYAYYERTEPMFSNVLRDAELVDLARRAVAPLHAYLEEAAEILASGRPGRGKAALLIAALRHAIAFPTWHSLTANGIARSDAARLITALVEAATAPSAARPPNVPGGCAVAACLQPGRQDIDGQEQRDEIAVHT